MGDAESEDMLRRVRLSQNCNKVDHEVWLQAKCSSSSAQVLFVTEPAKQHIHLNWQSAGGARKRSR